MHTSVSIRSKLAEVHNVSVEVDSLRVHVLVTWTTIIHKIFETNSSYHVK